ncbi:hypothetical protein DFH28DRAFT_878276 [Melampsora americana]|nr:hypothetical protein DFH28DRAFT_878276 [Melampsora americana]
MLNESGKSNADQVLDALALYKNNANTAFKDVSSYNIVKDAPKWQENPFYVQHCGNTNGSQELSELNLSSNLDTLPPMECPIGSKQAKRGRSNLAEELVLQILENQALMLKSQNSVADTNHELNRELALQGKAAQASLQSMVDWTILTTEMSKLDNVARAEIEEHQKEIICRSRVLREAE